MVRVPDLQWADRGFDSRPRHYWPTPLGKLFTPMCLCSPSSIIWYLARAFMLMRINVAASGMGPMNKGSIVVAVLKRS